MFYLSSTFNVIFKEVCEFVSFSKLYSELFILFIKGFLFLSSLIKCSSNCLFLFSKLFSFPISIAFSWIFTIFKLSSFLIFLFIEWISFLASFCMISSFVVFLSVSIAIISLSSVFSLLFSVFICFWFLLISFFLSFCCSFMASFYNSSESYFL